MIPKTLSESAYHRIRNDIITGKIAAGSKLRLESLCKEYDVGMTPLREALTRLIGDAMVMSEGQRGFWVTPLSIKELEDLNNIRRLIEAEAMQRAIELGDKAWEEQLKKSFEELSFFENQLPQTDEEFAQRWENANRRFHEALVAACDSPWLLKIRDILYRQSERYRIISLVTSTPGNRNVHDEHEAIYEAAIQRKAMKACKLLELHLERTFEAVRAALKASAGKGESKELESQAG